MNTTNTPAARRHELKTDPAVFAAVLAGAKTHEIRKNDRGFAVGDDLLLRETTYTGEQMGRGYPLHYTGRELERSVSHVLSGYGLQDGWCILSLAQARLAAQPVVAKPLSAHEIECLWSQHAEDACPGSRRLAFARAVEAEVQARAALAAPVAAQADTTEQDEWRVGEFWSSANPGMRVLMLARGIDIENFGQHKDFIRWVGRSSADADATSAGEADTAVPEHYSLRLQEAKSIIESLISEWQPGFLDGKYDSDEPEENALRTRVNAWLMSAVSQAVEQPADDAEDARTQAARDVLAERRRQVEAEGWTPEHDDMHADGQMAVAAGYYALACGYPGERDIGRGHVPQYWPWAPSWWKPKGARANLIRAGALILAEIERLDRAAAVEQKGAA